MPQTDSLIINGLAGKKTLHGEVHIKGAKNAILKAMAASILFEEAVELQNVSDTADIESMSDLLIGLGAKVTSNPVTPVKTGVLELKQDSRFRGNDKKNGGKDKFSIDS